jgi:tripeptide aminopeptidase
MLIDRTDLLQRFLQYVRVNTQANAETQDYPSSPGQLQLGRHLTDELLAMGLSDAHQDVFGIVAATLPANVPRDVPVIAFNAHLDTSPEASGDNVNPQVIVDYAGGDILLPGDPSKVIKVSESPELEQLRGATLITTDGTTLLGADDKAGVAVIMQAIRTFREHPELPHGAIRVLFTCDEEIGRGVTHVDLNKLGAQACYTLDGSGANTIDTETFSADLATVTIRGVNIHPAIAKDRMVNAIRATGHFLAQLPADMSPERTADRDGFLHPYWIQGQVDRVVLRILLRDFATAALEEQAKLLHVLAAHTETAIPGCHLTIEVTPQYRNMGDGLAIAPHVVEFAELAHRRLGREPERTIVRGGTDGSRLTELGLPTPNLSTGQHNLHSILEWACLDEMVLATEVVVKIAEIWAENAR